MSSSSKPQSGNPGVEDSLLDNDLMSGDTDLSSTVGAFRSRFERKKQEREVQEDLTERAQSIRHQRMLRALVNIRRSLIDVARIDLGDRYSFKLQADDWHGWPRVRINLFDSIIPDAEYPFLQVTAHDRHARGMVEIAFDPEKKPESVSLADQSGLNRLPTVLKKATRAYLDRVAEIVLKGSENSTDYEDRSALVEDKKSQFDEEDTSKIEGDLFVSDEFAADFLEALPEIDSLDSLPDVEPISPKQK
jgi:hypothetical protein